MKLTGVALAAGRGVRLAPWTDTTPKPLLPVGSTTLLDRALHWLVAAGCEELIVNARHLSAQFPPHLATHASRIPLTLSLEHGDLETAGGLRQMGPLLGGSDVLLHNGDACHDLPPEGFMAQLEPLIQQGFQSVLAVVPVDPDHADFALVGTRLHPKGAAGRPVRFMGVAWLAQPMLEQIPAVGSLGPWYHRRAAAVSIAAGLGGVLHEGFFVDAGTPADLERARQMMTPSESP